jgi:hypothetical protein
MVPIKITVEATDASGPVSSKILSVGSNEAGAGEYQITGDLTLNLLADRLGKGKAGRIYTITVQCSDPFNNACTGTVAVKVAHDKGK